MQLKNSNNIDPDLMNRIVNVAYQDASVKEIISVYLNALVNFNIRKLLNEYKATAQSVHSIKEEELSDSIIERVNSRINIQKRKEDVALKFHRGFLFIFSKPVYSYSIAGILVLTTLSFLLFNDPSQNSKYTKAEIEIAQKQLDETLAIVSKVIKNTSEQLDKKVLDNNVSKPLNKGLNLINELITGG